MKFKAKYMLKMTRKSVKKLGFTFFGLGVHGFEQRRRHPARNFEPDLLE